MVNIWFNTRRLVNVQVRLRLCAGNRCRHPGQFRFRLQERKGAHHVVPIQGTVLRVLQARLGGPTKEYSRLSPSRSCVCLLGSQTPAEGSVKSCLGDQVRGSPREGLETLT